MNDREAEREVKRIGDWLVAQSALEPPEYKPRRRKYKRPSPERIERAKKKAMVAAMIAARRGRA